MSELRGRRWLTASAADCAAQCWVIELFLHIIHRSYDI
jgi:hypothetical protein